MDATQTDLLAAIRALKVLTLTKATVAFLLENDPQALLQALKAVRPFVTDPPQVEALDASLLAASRACKAPFRLTSLEELIIVALRQQADDCSGGDFGIVQEVTVPGITRQALGGVLTSLQTKGILTVHDPITVNEGSQFARTVTQFTFDNR